MSGLEAKRKTQMDEERQRKQDSYQQALAQQSAARLQLEQEKGQRDQTTFGEDEADRKSKLAQTKAIDAQNAGLKYPANWEKLPPPIQIRYLQNRLQAELASHNDAGAKLTQDRIAEIQTAYNKQQEDAARLKAAAIAQAATAHNEALNRGAANTRSANEIGAGNARSANTIAADNERQQAGFRHSDAAATASHAFTHAENQARFKHEEAAKAAALKAKTAGMNPEHVKEWAALQANPRILALPLKQLNVLQASYYAYGGEQALSHFKDIASGKVQSPAVTAAEASNIVTVLSGSGL
jgi:hypothetical protein